MFDLEQTLADWRKQMLIAGIQSPVPLEELELHLREEIEARMNSGMTPGDAFHSAKTNLGTAHSVQGEFEKEANARVAFNWKRVAVLFGGFAFVFPVMIGSLAFVFPYGEFSELTFGQRISCLAAAITCSVLAWSSHWGRERFPMMQSNRSRDFILLPVMLWLVVFAYIVMPHTSFAAGQRTVVSLWGLAPFGIVLG